MSKCGISRLRRAAPTTDLLARSPDILAHPYVSDTYLMYSSTHDMSQFYIVKCSTERPSMKHYSLRLTSACLIPVVLLTTRISNISITILRVHLPGIITVGHLTYRAVRINITTSSMLKLLIPEVIETTRIFKAQIHRHPFTMLNHVHSISRRSARPREAHALQVSAVDLRE